MRKAKVFYKNEEAGELLQQNNGFFTFIYSDDWLKDQAKPSISLTLPKVEKQFVSPFLFPFFYNILPEGSNKQLVCKLKKIDSKDPFGLLMTIAGSDTIGAVQVIKIEEK